MKRQVFGMKKKGLYQLVGISLDTIRYGDKRIHKQKDGSILTDEFELGIFTSVECAETMIKSYVSGCSHDVLLVFILYERSVDQVCEPGGHFRLYESIRSYLPNGDLNCESDLDSECEKLFKVQNPETLKLKNGDYAYAYEYGKAIPILVGAIPVDQSWYERRKKKDSSFQGGDWSDDAYFALSVNGRFHPSAPMVFPEFCPINKSVKRKLDYSLKVEMVPGEYDKWVK